MAEVKRIRSPASIGAAVPQPNPLHRDRADAGLNLALRPMAVADNAVPPVGQLHAPHLGKECVSLRLDSLSQQVAARRWRRTAVSGSSIVSG